MANVTKHGAKRMKERLGLQKKAINRHADIALEKGLTHAMCKGNLKRYIDGLYLKHKTGFNYRIYNHSVYMFTFDTHKLITTIPLPQSLHKLADTIQKQKERDAHERTDNTQHSKA